MARFALDAIGDVEGFGGPSRAGIGARGVAAQADAALRRRLKEAAERGNVRRFREFQRPIRSPAGRKGLQRAAAVGVLVRMALEADLPAHVERQPILARREKLISEVRTSIRQLSDILAQVQTMDMETASDSALGRIRKELETSLEVAKRVEDRMASWEESGYTLEEETPE